MLNLFSNASLNQSAPSGVTESGAAVTGAEGGEIAINGASFAELLTSETSLAGMLEELKTLLSAEDFATLEDMFAEGQTLPLAEIVAALRQQLSATGIEQIAPQSLKLSDVISDLKGVAEKIAEASEGNVAEGEEVSLAAGQNIQIIVPITLGKSTIPVAIAADQAAVVQATNGKPTQPGATVAGQMAISANPDSDAAELSFNMGNSSADSDADQQSSTGQFRMMEAVAAQVAEKTPFNNLFRTTEAGLTAVNNAPVTLQTPIQASAQPLSQLQVNALSIHTPMGEKGWDQAVGERMLWMVGRQIQGAEVRITPPQLGPIDIRISIQNDQANVTFAAQHGVVREALEASIPRLREILGENNLQLVNVDINQRNTGEQRTAHFFDQASSGEQGGEGYEFDEEERMENGVLVLRSDGLVDDFA